MAEQVGEAGSEAAKRALRRPQTGKNGNSFSRGVVTPPQSEVPPPQSEVTLSWRKTTLVKG